HQYAPHQICVLTDLPSLHRKANENQEQERQLIGLRNWMMAVLAFPVGVFVVTMMWAIYLYDSDLVYPWLLDNFIPQWLNHGMHTTVLPFILIEMRLTHHFYPSWLCGLVTACSFAQINPVMTFFFFNGSNTALRAGAGQKWLGSRWEQKK
uniref:Androgen-induced 1 (H. sapiens) n=1 Tax=Erpetoichthys calabaricus TaxID=27687 RepID=A0A8C4RL58_ERPCA